MNCNTGELISFDNEEDMKKFFEMQDIKDNNDKFVLVENHTILAKELEAGKVDNKEVRELLCQISDSRNLPRPVRRRLEKKLYKLRTNDTK